MNLHDAIYTPRVERQVRNMKKIREMPVQDSIRRAVTLNNENIQILDFKDLEMVEKTFKNKKKNRIQIPKPKKTLLEKFISLFK